MIEVEIFEKIQMTDEIQEIKGFSALPDVKF